MFPELQDYGLIFVSLAVFGFIVLDIFKTGQYWGIPDFYKSNVEKFFHYVSTAILVLSFSLVFIGLAIGSPNPENAVAIFIKGFFSAFDKIHELGVIGDEGYAIALKIFALATYFAFIYIVIYFIVFYLGIYFRIINGTQINVFLRDRCEPIKFASLITESNEFFYFLKIEGINLWEAIRKDDIARIETTKVRSRLENWTFDLINWTLSLKNKIRIRHTPPNVNK